MERLQIGDGRAAALGGPIGNQYNLLIDLAYALLVGAMLLAERRQTRRSDSLDNRLLRVLMLCCTLALLIDMPGLLLDGRAFPGARALLWVFDTACRVFQIVCGWLWLLLADYRAFGSEERVRRRAPVYALPMLAELALILFNLSGGWVFTLEDDGIGFDAEAPKADGRTHIGICNVRERLERMCGGTLTITSAPGAGAVAGITIPKWERTR